ncbi:MAG: electron transport complex subunit RsxC, partial [Halomonas sp.]|nr:electron transport complex subunit RsxC [Halomonas sp.]
MARTFEFHGGVYPPERKQRSQGSVRHATLPGRVVLRLDQHAGRPALATVAVGDSVKVGMPVARRDGMISADLHASISGKVTQVDRHSIAIDGDGVDTWQRLTPLEWRNASAEQLLTRLEQSGVVGLGGAGFPTHIKARVGERQRIDTLVVNAAECEPYITVDDLTLQQYASDVLEGAQLIASLCGAKQITVGIEDNKPEAISALRQTMAGSQPLSVAVSVIATRYPSGGERQLIKTLLNRDVPDQG